MKSKKETLPAREAAPGTLWTKAEGLSPLALQDFGKFLMERQGHREGKVTCLQMSTGEPLEVTFFGDGQDSDDVFEIRQEVGKGLRVSTMRGDSQKIAVLLEEFGMSPAGNS